MFNSNVDNKMNNSINKYPFKISNNINNISNQKKIIFQHFQKSSQHHNFTVATARKNENLYNIQKLNGDNDDDEKMLD